MWAVIVTISCGSGGRVVTLQLKIGQFDPQIPISKVLKPSPPVCPNV